MPDVPPNHKGKQARTYRRGSQYITDILGSTCTAVHMDRISHADCVFASRHRDDDDFCQAEALARAYAILCTANERAINPSPKITRVTATLRVAAYDHLVKWDHKIDE